jgi:hypothetical protein
MQHTDITAARRNAHSGGAIAALQAKVSDAVCTLL